MKMLTQLLILFLCLAMPQVTAARWVGDKWVPDTPQDRAVQKKAAIKERADFVDRYENALLSKGMDVVVTASGSEKTTFKMKYVLINRPFVYNLANDGTTLETLHHKGFTKAIYTDGYDKTWTFDLKKMFSPQKKK